MAGFTWPTRQANSEPLPLVLLPGTLCDERLFQPVISALGDQPTDVTVYGDAATVEQAADHIMAQAPARFALLGFSLGAIVALDIAIRCPDRVVGLALVAGTARAVPGKHQKRRRHQAEAAVGQISAFVAEHLLPHYVGQAAANDRAIRNMVLSMADHAGGAAYGRQTSIALSRLDRRSALGSISLPALIVGGMEDSINPPPVQRELAHGLANAELAILPGVGHLVPLEAPAELARLMLEWLARIKRAERDAIK